MNPQGEFDFEAAQDESDYTKWLTGHKVAVRELSQRLGLPIGREAEVWLTGGVRLRGKLRLKEEVLVIEEESVRHLELQIAGVPFALREMESCVRLD